MRVLDVPSDSPARVRAAIELRLDELTPLPPETVTFTWTSLPSAKKDSRRYAVAVARKDAVHAVALACEPPPDSVLCERTVEGAALTFAFPTPFGVMRRRDRWLARAPGLIALLAGLSLLLLSVTYRLQRENGALLAEVVAAEAAQSATRRAAVEQSVAAALWRGASAAETAETLDCALANVATAAPDNPIADLDARGGEVRIALAKPVGATEAAILRTRGADFEPALAPGAGATVRFPTHSCVGASR